MIYTISSLATHDFFVWAKQDIGEVWEVTDDSDNPYDFTGMSATMNIKGKNTDLNLITITEDVTDSNGYLSLSTGLITLLLKKEIFDVLSDGEYSYTVVITYPSDTMTKVWIVGKIEVTGNVL